jgi:hypothetical protein
VKTIPEITLEKQSQKTSFYTLTKQRTFPFLPSAKPLLIKAFTVSLYYFSEAGCKGKELYSLPPNLFAKNIPLLRDFFERNA